MYCRLDWPIFIWKTKRQNSSLKCAIILIIDAVLQLKTDVVTTHNYFFLTVT